jgi:osmotically-inducible protein OsmY
MAQTVRSVLVFALLAVLMSGCVALTGKSAGQTIDDVSITAAVKAKLAGEKMSTLTRIDVDTNQGVVYLTGTVDSLAMKQRAADIARQVKGVRDVVNNLTVRTAQ